MNKDKENAIRVIAEYMGYDINKRPKLTIGNGCLCRFETITTNFWNEEGYDGVGVPNYHLDIHTLKPVWEKLGLNVNLSYQPKTKTYRCRVWEYGGGELYKEGKPPKKYKKAEEAVLFATAEAIEKQKS